MSECEVSCSGFEQVADELGGGLQRTFCILIPAGLGGGDRASPPSHFYDRPAHFLPSSACLPLLARTPLLQQCHTGFGCVTQSHVVCSAIFRAAGIVNAESEVG